MIHRCKNFIFPSVVTRRHSVRVWGLRTSFKHGFNEPNRKASGVGFKLPAQIGVEICKNHNLLHPHIHKFGQFFRLFTNQVVKFWSSLLFCLTAQAGDLSLDELCLCRNLQPTVLPNGACLLLVVQDEALSYDSGRCHRCCTRPKHSVRKRNQARQVGWVCPYFQGLLQAVYKGIGFGFLCNWMAVLRTEHACIRQEILRAVTNAELCQKTQLVCFQNEIQTSSYWDWLHP